MLYQEGKQHLPDVSVVVQEKSSQDVHSQNLQSKLSEAYVHLLN